MNCDEFNQTQDRFCVSHEKIDIFLHFCICFWCVCGVNLSEPAVSSLTKRQREYCDVNCDSFHHLFPPLKSHNFSLKRFELVVVVHNNPNFFLYFNSNSMTAQKTANIMLCLFVICLFLYSHPLVLTGVIIVVVQFSVELGRFHESRFHHLHLLRLQLLLCAVKLRLDPNQLEGDVCHFKRFLLNDKLFWLWRACSCVPAGLWGPSPGGVSPTSPSPAAAKLTHWCFSRRPVLPTSLQSGKKQASWWKEGGWHGASWPNWKKKNQLYGKRRVATHPALQSIGVESQLVPLLLHPLQLQLVLLDLLLEHSM